MATEEVKVTLNLPDSKDPLYFTDCIAQASRYEARLTLYDMRPKLRTEIDEQAATHGFVVGYFTTNPERLPDLIRALQAQYESWQMLRMHQPNG